jgi:hypothetical protein
LYGSTAVDGGLRQFDFIMIFHRFMAERTGQQQTSVLVLPGFCNFFLID